MLAPSNAPYFSVYNVGAYTFAPYKVVWAEISRTFAAAVASTCTVGPLARPKVIVPDHKVYFAPFEHPEPALFLCALLNSTVVRRYIDAITEKLQVGSLLNRINLPQYNPDDATHRALVALARDGVTQYADPRRVRIDELANCLLQSET